MHCSKRDVCAIVIDGSDHSQASSLLDAKAGQDRCAATLTIVDADAQPVQALEAAGISLLSQLGNSAVFASLALHKIENAL